MIAKKWNQFGKKNEINQNQSIPKFAFLWNQSKSINGFGWNQSKSINGFGWNQSKSINFFLKSIFEINFEMGSDTFMVLNKSATASARFFQNGKSIMIAQSLISKIIDF